MLPLFKARRRPAVHYVLAILTMGLYGGQVCPLVESIPIIIWMSQLTTVFGLLYIIRPLLLQHVVDPAPLHKQVGRQVSLDFAIFVACGLSLTLLNAALYGFPSLESGSKMVLGTTALGFFVAVDQGLSRERWLALQLGRRRTGLIVDSSYFPITVKFATVASITALSVSAIILLVVLKDINWMAENSITDPHMARIAVIKEIIFVTLVCLAHVFNLIFSYTRNLNAALARENQALIQVAEGNLNSHVIVSSNDEFGIMAQYTNKMIAMLRKNTLEIQQTRDATILALAGLAETRDNETGAHIRRTQNYVRVLAEHLANHPKFSHGLDATTIDLFYKSAPLHDIGKVGIPDAILLKPGKLTDEEFEIMKQHTILGAQALVEAARNLGDNNFLVFAREIAYHHHEKWDGSGYPQGLVGDDIPLAARLMALADVYDALISKRVYKKAFSHEKSKGIILEGRGTHFDPDVIDAFVAIEDQFITIAERFKDGRQVESDAPPRPGTGENETPAPNHTAPLAAPPLTPATES